MSSNEPTARLRLLCGNPIVVLSVFGESQQVLGLGAEELLGSDLRERIEPEDLAGLADLLGVNPVLQDGAKSTGSAAFRLRDASGRLRSVRAMYAKEHSESGETVLDLTLTAAERDSEADEAKEISRLFIEHAPVALAMFDREMRCLAANHHWRKSFGVEQQEIAGSSFDELMPGVPEHWRAQHQRALAGESVKGIEEQIVGRNGQVQWLRQDAHPWFNRAGTVGGVLVFAENTTERVRATEELELAASVFRHAREGIIITDPQGNILDVNETFTRITGYRRDEVLGRNPRMLQSGRQSPEYYRDLWRGLLETGQWTGEIWNRTKEGQVYPELLNISAVYDGVGQVRHYVALFSDLTEAKEHQAWMERASYYDALTNLPNLTLMMDRLQQDVAQAHRRGQMLAVACLDLDGFRRVNEERGHEAADQLLVELARRMTGALREGDTLARIGGNKFVALLLDLGDAASARQLLERLRSAATDPVSGGRGAELTASMGVAFYPQADNVAPAHLLRQAERAMYQAKLAGKGRSHYFDPVEDAVIRTHREDLEAIRGALDASEFVFRYQPIVNMSTGDLIGVEALIRWQHPTKGLLPPADFLPVIENHPLMERVGEWGLGQALQDLEMWRGAGLKINVSVNIAARHLQQPEFLERLVAILEEHPGVQPGWLELEILETGAVRDMGLVAHVLTKCREMGVSVALDDFGTGYSSLSWLRRLPVNVLKIDQSFVREMLDSPGDLSILEGVLGLASAFDRTAVAEGVETVEHGRLLLQLGCVYGQGYGIARPMPAEQLGEWSRAWQPDPNWARTVSLGPEHRGLLQAAVAHRAWAAEMEAHLRSEGHMPPPPDAHRCRLGIWLERERSRAGEEAPMLEEIEQMHGDMHAVATRLAGPWKRLGAEARLAHFLQLSENLTTRLERLLQPEAS